MTDVNGTLYFTADDGAHGRELYKIEGDGTGAASWDIAPGAQSSLTSWLTNVNGTLYFTSQCTSC